MQLLAFMINILREFMLVQINDLHLYKAIENMQILMTILTKT